MSGPWEAYQAAEPGPWSAYQAQDRELAKSALIAHNTDPERHAKNIAAAKEQGIPVAFATGATVPHNPQHLDNLITKFQMLPSHAPNTATFVANPDNAKLAHDDTDALSKFENIIRGIEHSSIIDAGTTLANLITTPVRQVFQGYRGMAAAAGTLAGGGNIDQALAAGQESMTQDEEKFGYKPETGAGKAVEKVISYPFEKWSELGDVAVPSRGHPVLEAMERTAWELAPFLLGAGKGPKEKLAAQMADGRAAAMNAAKVKMLADAAKESKLAKRDAATFKAFAKENTADVPPVKIPVQTVDEILAKSGKAPEEVFESPETYHQAKMTGQPVEVPMSDVAGMAEHITPDNIKEMSIGDTPSVAKVEEQIKPQEKINGQEEGRGQEVLNGQGEGVSTPSPSPKVQPQGEFGSQAGGTAPEAGSLAFGMDLPKYAGSVNLERVNADYPVKKLILDTADRYKGQIDEARRGTITLDETKALADDLGMTVDDLLKRNKGEAYNAEQVTAARNILNTSATRLRQIQEAAAKIGSDEALLEFRKALDLHAAIQAEVSGASTEAGRALSAHRIASQPSKNYKAMLDALGGREVNEEILKRFSQVDTTNIQEVNKFIKEFARVKKSSMIYEAWISFLLSGIKTHVVNLSSNILSFSTKPVETLAAAGVEAVRAKAAGVPRERFANEAIQELFGAKAGLSDGVTASLRAWREELPADTLVKFDTPSPYGGAIPGEIGKTIRGPLRSLSASDEFMKAVIYTGELYGQAYRIARLEGLKGDAISNRIGEIVTNPSEKLKQIAKDEADYRTFNQKLGPFSKKINALREIPGAKAIVPFYRTLTNIAKFGLERTPFNFGRLAYKIKKGEISGAAISDELAKPILGTLIAAAVVELASEGMITGGGPKDKNSRAMLLRTGWQPYSFKVGDNYVPYGRLEPIGTVFGMSADFVELANMADSDEKTISDYAEALSLSFTKNLLSKTFVMGVSNALDAVQDPKRYGEQWISAMAGTVVPSIAANATQVMDPTIRAAEGPVDRIKSRLPYLSQDLMPKRDIWGREIIRPGNALERAISPSPVSTDTKDPVDTELARLGMNIGLPSKSITVDGKKIRLSPMQYDRYVQRTGERAYEEVSQIIDAGMDDDAKKDAIENIFRKIRGEERDILANEIRQE